MYIFQYKDLDDLQQVFKYRVNLLDEIKLPPDSVFGRKIALECEPNLFLSENYHCDGKVIVLARQHRQVCIKDKVISVAGLQQAVDKLIRF